jgi:hypothetical protein
MAWDDLLNNQMVSFTDAQTSGFPLIPGETNPGGDRNMTKSEILFRYNVNIGTTYANPYLDNQLVPKIDWLSKSTSIELCYSETSINEACLCVLPTSILGNTNTSLYITSTSPAGGIWTRYFTPINTIIRNRLSGTQIPNTYYASGATNSNVKNQKLYVPSQNVQNIQVKVISDGLRTTTTNSFNSCVASLYWCVASVNEQFPGQEIIGTSDGVPIYDIDFTKSIRFPNSPTINSNSGGNTPLLNTEYTATIPQINSGEALYVFWYCQGSNQSSFQFGGFSTLNMRISITQL